MHPNDNVKQNNILDIKQFNSNIKNIALAFHVEVAKIKISKDTEMKLGVWLLQKLKLKKRMSADHSITYLSS